MPKRQMKLGAFLFDAGHHAAAWRHPSSPSSPGTDYSFLFDLVRTAERGKFDLCFTQDSMSVNLEAPEMQAHLARGGMQWEPTTLIGALQATVRNIGFIATVSTSYTEPYHVARKFATLDLLGGGRTGWNIVTSTALGEAANFGKEANLPHEVRYERGSEFADIVLGLWNSWEPDAFLHDKERGLFYDHRKLHPLNHKGKYFSVRGPLGVAPSPQGRPVVVVATTSAPGAELAARVADLVFTEQNELDMAQAFYKDTKARLARYGRPEDALAILPGASVLVEKSASEAREKFQELQNLIDPEVGVHMLSTITDLDFRGYPVDGPVPQLPLNDLGNINRQKRFLAMAKEQDLTLRQLYEKVLGARGHWTFVGDPVQVADELASRFEARACDGYNIFPSLVPDQLEKFVDLVIPELQNRGLFRTEYKGSTLRSHLYEGTPLEQDSGSALYWPARQ